MPGKLAIIADDFTGASDAAVQFAAYGLKTVVSLSLNDAAGFVQSYDVVSYTTDTREVDAADAYRQVKAAAETLLSFGFEWFYKKVDSTLRGNIGAELDAVMDGLGVKLCLLAPAYPAYRRTTVGGYLLVDGLPLAQSYYGADLTTSARESYVPRLVEAQSSKRVGLLPLSTVMKGPTAVAEAVRSMASSGFQILVGDAVTDYDLRSLAQGLLAAGPEAVPAGSAGLAAQLPEPLGLVSQGPILILSGSPNPVSVKQTLEAQRATGAKLIDIDGRIALLDGEGRERTVAALLDEVRQLQPVKTPVILTTTLGENVAETRKKGCEQGLSSGEVGLKVAETLAEIAVKAAEALGFTGIVMVGGMTALAALRAFDAKAVELKGEVAPGTPLGRLLGGRWDGLPVVTKAGGFGAPDAIIDALRHLGRFRQASGSQSA
ncbi:MAG: four-carbon acid sugar kinase family protein [Candidatus Bathyarchaeia archaeon]